MLDVSWGLSFLLLGSFVGFMAGLLGIGGGAIMVPMLTSIFLFQGVPSDNVVHLALGTSMASIIATSFSSLRAHHARGGVHWKVVKKMVPGIVIGTFLATFLALQLSSRFLAVFFATFMAYVSLQMYLNKTPKQSRGLVGGPGLLAAGSGIGAISALVSIGGGTLTVPFLIWQNVNIKKAIGTSAAIGFPISIVGTLGYIINGWDNPLDVSYSYGYVYLPSVLLISLSSVFTAPLGAKLAHKLDVSILKKIFSMLLIILSAQMLFSIL
jgi:uncharacterized membrane protein YfcA